ncbi:tetratricopeptide repeat protein [Streptomyces yaizuensis]|uniref:Tetratricopeptide repeat protein n=1 Tax=Streptomyces yaizuensis TaxID=2989713 RepID=A0ABQ5NT85_9ACTN|nr:tetratricopeptide repeat protein [Streptomyces sp. YSPA8]GLF93557.1 tetratricopeptide repeat protein [Streptomyces sp. YSPA8]
MTSSSQSPAARPAGVPDPLPDPPPGAPDRRPVPNTAFRRLRGKLSPGEFAIAVRRAAREIGEHVSCDARYIGRVESGEIRCPNYAYERVFSHMYPELTPADLGFTARETVRGGGRRRTGPDPAARGAAGGSTGPGGEESEVLRREFMTGAPATVAGMAGASLGLGYGLGHALRGSGGPRRASEPEVAAVEDAVRRIRLLDDRHGADGLHRRAAQPLRAAYALLDTGLSGPRKGRGAALARLHTGTGELALSVGWLAHDSARPDEARSHYAEALAIARAAGDRALEAHAFSNTSFLARDLGRHREAVRAAQAGTRAARGLGSPQLLSLLALREAAGWAGLGDRPACERALHRAHRHFERDATAPAPAWMSFFGRPELESLQSQCRAALGAWRPAAAHAAAAADLQDPRFTRNLALYRADQALALARASAPDEAAVAAHRALDLLDGGVRSARVRCALDVTGALLRGHLAVPGVPSLLARTHA